jgi:hypothetical protein
MIDPAAYSVIAGGGGGYGAMLGDVTPRGAMGHGPPSAPTAAKQDPSQSPGQLGEGLDKALQKLGKQINQPQSTVDQLPANAWDQIGLNQSDASAINFMDSSSDPFAGLTDADVMNMAFGGAIRRGFAQGGGDVASMSDDDFSQALQSDVQSYAAQHPAPSQGATSPSGGGGISTNRAETTPQQRADFYRQYIAQKYPGKDPNVALGVAKAEGLGVGGVGPSRVDVDPRTGQPFSFGDFQMNVHPGALGDQARRAGYDPTDPNQWQDVGKYAIDKMYGGDGYNLGPWKGDKYAKAYAAGTAGPVNTADLPSTGAQPASGDLTGYGGMGIDPETRTLLNRTLRRQLEIADQPAPSSSGNRQSDFFNALTMAGFGMMAGTSPYAGVNIGQGGMKGMEYYQKEQELNHAWALNDAQIRNLSAEQLAKGADTALRLGNLDLEMRRFQMLSSPGEEITPESVAAGMGGAGAGTFKQPGTGAPIAAPIPTPAPPPAAATPGPGPTAAVAPIAKPGAAPSVAAGAVAPPASAAPTAAAPAAVTGAAPAPTATSAGPPTAAAPAKPPAAVAGAADVPSPGAEPAQAEAKAAQPGTMGWYTAHGVAPSDNPLVLRATAEQLNARANRMTIAGGRGAGAAYQAEAQREFDRATQIEKGEIKIPFDGTIQTLPGVAEAQAEAERQKASAAKGGPEMLERDDNMNEARSVRTDARYRLEQLLDLNDKLATGALAPTADVLSRYGQYLGVPPQYATNFALFNKYATQEIYKELKEQKGQVRNMEIAGYTKQMADVTNPGPANRELLISALGGLSYQDAFADSYWNWRGGAGKTALTTGKMENDWLKANDPERYANKYYVAHPKRPETASPGSQLQYDDQTGKVRWYDPATNKAIDRRGNEIPVQ